MSLLLKPNGDLAVKGILPMSARQVTWFIDPEALLRHLGDLKTVKVAAFCQHCYERGLPEDVTASFNPDGRKWTVHCACADYPEIREQGAGPMVVRKVHDDGTFETVKIHSVDELLFRLGWSFKCAGDCARYGMHDGVQGHNDSTTLTLKVSCGCTERVYQQPGDAA